MQQADWINCNLPQLYANKKEFQYYWMINNTLFIKSLVIAF